MNLCLDVDLRTKLITVQAMAKSILPLFSCLFPNKVTNNIAEDLLYMFSTRAALKLVQLIFAI